MSTSAKAVLDAAVEKDNPNKNQLIAQIVAMTNESARVSTLQANSLREQINHSWNIVRTVDTDQLIDQARLIASWINTCR